MVQHRFKICRTGIHPGIILLGLTSFLFIFAQRVCPQDTERYKRLSLAFEIGNWQPHSLNDEPRFDTFGAAGATPFYGFAFSTPIVGELGIRFSLGYWSLRDLEETETVHSLTLHPICVDLKYWLVPDYRLSAFVMYGGGVYWGIENDTTPFGAKLRKARAGWGASLGAGFDLVITKKFGLGMSFQYHLVHFKEPLGGVEDFSGPKITFTAFYFL